MTSDADRSPRAGDGADRVREHPVLGPLPPAPAVAFTFDGRPIAARDGEPIVAALLAAGVRVVRTMPGSGEARGGYCLVGRCPDCLVVVDGQPNVRACVTPIRAGMRIATQRGLGEDAWDLGDARPASKPDRGAGRRAVRRAQVAVIGGGPAGLGAAIAAAEAGAATVLFEEQPRLGGQLCYRVAEIASGGTTVLPAALRAGLVGQAEAAGVEIRPHSVAWGLFEDNVLGVADERSSYQMMADALVIATGSTDLPLPFAGGSLPGVFSARAVQILLNQHRVLPGRRFAVLGGGPEAAEVAISVRLAGADVALSVDPLATGVEVVAEGPDGVRAVLVAGERVAVEVVVVAVGRQPDAALALMAGCVAGYATDLGGHVPVVDDRLRTSDPRILVAGDAAGVCDAATALAEGRYAGTGAAATLGLVAAPALAAARATYEEAAATRIAVRRGLEPIFVQAYQ